MRNKLKYILLYLFFAVIIFFIILDGVLICKKNNDGYYHTISELCRLYREGNPLYQEKLEKLTFRDYYSCEPGADLIKEYDNRLNIMGNYFNYMTRPMIVLSQYGLQLIVFILVGIYFGSKYRSKFYLNELTRQSYKKTIKKYINRSYLLSTIVPLTGVIILFLFSFVSNSYSPAKLVEILSSSVISDRNLESLHMSPYYYYHPLLFYIIFIFNLFLLGIILTNLILIVIRKVKNIAISIFASYTVYTMLERLLFYVLVYPGVYFVYYILKFPAADDMMSYFSLTTALMPFHIYHPLFYSLVLFIIVSLTLLIVKKSYSNKEKVVIESEK